MKPTLTLVLIIFCLSNLFSQISNERKGLKWQPSLKVSKIFGHDYTIGIQRTEVEELNDFAIIGGQLVAEYFFNPRIGLGIGLGLDRYFGRDFTTCPLIFDLKWFANRNPSSPFISISYTPFLELNDQLENGLGLYAGLGFSKVISPKLSFWVKSEIGTSRIRITPEKNYDHHDFSHINLHIGLMF